MQVLHNHRRGGQRPHSNVRESPQHEHQSSWLARKHRDTSKANQNDRLHHVQKTPTTILHAGDLIYVVLFNFKKAKTIVKTHERHKIVTAENMPSPPRAAFKKQKVLIKVSLVKAVKVIALC